MPNSPHLSQAAVGKTYTISVVGPPKAGKSCLCNRFALPHPDYYREDHLSVLSTTDFVGEIVNFEHWLYWGCVSRQVDDYTVNFRIIEQTEFIDDTTFQPITLKKYGVDSSSVEDYVQRSTTVHLSSERKLRYICKEQLGQENIYEKEYFPSGEIEVNGFILVCDIGSQLIKDHPRLDRSYIPQQTIIQEFLTLLLKLKKPVVLAISKFDAYGSQAFEELSLLLQKSNDFKKVPVIETSAHKNINVEQTFRSLVKLIDKPRTAKVKYPRYVDAVRDREKELAASLHSFYKVLNKAPCEFLNSWEAFMARYSQQTDVVTYICLVGTTVARNKFEKYAEHRRQLTKQHNLDQIAGLLSHFVPNLDLVRNKSFAAVVQYIRDQENFSVYFRDAPVNLILPEPNRMTGCSAGSQRSVREDTRIPFGLVVEPYNSDPEGSPLQHYLNALVIAERRHFEQAKLETFLQNMLTQNSLCEVNGAKCPTGILPGQPISDLHYVLEPFLSSALDEESVNQVYNCFQTDLRARAREQFSDLLLEHTDIFFTAAYMYMKQLCDIIPSDAPASLEARAPTVLDAPYRIASFDSRETGASLGGSMGISTSTGTGDYHGTSILSAPPRGLKETHLHWLETQLSQDWRYRAMMFLPSERQTLVASYFNELLPSSSKVVHSTDNGSGGHLFAMDSKVPNYSNLCDSWLSSQTCPSITCGDCMDQLLKHLAYQYLPINPRCLEPGAAVSCRTNGGNETDLASRLDGVDTHPKISYLDCRSSTSNKTILSIGVACVCSDSLAAKAVVHLFGCAGFSMTSLLPHVVVDSANSVSVDCGSPDSANPPVQFGSLELSSTWPLSTARLPPLQVISPKTRWTEATMSSSTTITTAASAATITFTTTTTITATTTTSTCTTTTPSACTTQIYDGQVQVNLMSVHKMLRDLIAVETEAMKDKNSFSASDPCPCMEPFSIPVDRSPYQGYIFMVGESQNDEHGEPWFNPTDFISQTVSPTNAPEAPETPLTDSGVEQQSCNALGRVSSLDADFDGEAEENLLTPRPGSNKSFFASDIPIDPPKSQSLSNSAHIPPANNTPDPFCMCCTLFHGNHQPETECACGQCCTCAHAGLINQIKGQPLTTPGLSSPKLANSLTSSGFTKRSLNARLAAIRSVINLLPSETPHLVLLAREPPKLSTETHPEVISEVTTGGVISASTATNKEHRSTNGVANCNSQTPLIFPAPTSLCSRFDYCSSGKSTAACDVTAVRHAGDSATRSPVDSIKDDTEDLSDWMQEGTNVLDHVIRFLNGCWGKVDSLGNTGLSERVRQTRSHSATCQCVAPPKPLSDIASQRHKLNARSSGHINTLDHANKNPPTPEKSLNSSLFLSLSAASATGRRAMHTANQTLKKLSVSARKQHKNSPSSIPRSGVMSRLHVLADTPLVFHGPAASRPSSVVSHNKSLTLQTFSDGVTPDHSNQRLSSLENASDKIVTQQIPPVCWGLGGLSPENTDELPSVPRTASSEVISLSDSSSISPSPNPFLQSSMRCSMDQNLTVRRNTMSSPGTVSRSRCSVPDCTLLVSSEDYGRMLGVQPTSFSPRAVPVSSSHTRPHSSVLADTITQCFSTDANRLRIDCDTPRHRDSVPKETLLKGRSRIHGSPDSQGEYSQSARSKYTIDAFNGIGCIDKSSFGPVESSSNGISTTTITDLEGTSGVDWSSDSVILSSHSCPPYTPQATGMTNDDETSGDLARSVDDLESIYENLDLINSQLTPANLFCSDSPVGRDISRFVSLRPLLVSTNTEDSIYSEPIDCLGAMQLERLPCTGDHSFSSVTEPIKPAKEASDTRSLMTNKCFCSHCASTTVDLLGNRRRERHRSFSTPEGCTSALSDSDRCDMSVISLMRSEHIQGPSNLIPAVSARPLNSPCSYDPVSRPTTLDSTGSSSSGVPTTPSSSSLGNYRSPDPRQKHDVSVSLSVSLSSPVSGVLSESCLSERAITSGDEAVWTRDQRQHHSPRVAHRAHHHHFWHHSDCPHQRIHHVVLENFSIDSGYSNTPTGTHLFDPDLTRAAVTKQDHSFGRCSNSSTKSSEPSLSLRTSAAGLLRLKQRSLPGSVIAGTRTVTQRSTVCSSVSSTAKLSTAKMGFASNPLDGASHHTRPFVRNQSSIDSPQVSANTDIMSSSSSVSNCATISKDSKWMKRGKRVL